MRELAELRESIVAARSSLRATQRSCRTSLQFLADLEKRLDAYEAFASFNAEPERQSANGNSSSSSIPVRS